MLHAGTYTTVDVPNAARTFIYGMNDHRTIVGAYTNSTGATLGFVAKF